MRCSRNSLDLVRSYRVNSIGRLATIVEAKYPGRGFIDVGAHIGETAAIVRAHSQLPVLCIEGAPYFELLQANTRGLGSDVELECNVSAGCELMAPLAAILARHPRFQTSKVLKICATEGVLNFALEWIAAARPTLLLQHAMGINILDRLAAIDYRTALIFDGAGEFVQATPLDSPQHLADGGCNIFAFHTEDADICERFRQVGTTRANRDAPNFQSAELAAVRAHTELERHRLHGQIAELEGRLALKDAEIARLHAIVRDFLKSNDLKAQVRSLRQELDNSLALRAARSLSWILGPIRRRIDRASNGDQRDKPS